MTLIFHFHFYLWIVNEIPGKSMSFNMRQCSVQHLENVTALSDLLILNGATQNHLSL